MSVLWKEVLSMKDTYGLPYMGSKNRIAPILIKHLPKGQRFVDLFGGGFAMSEVALLSDKYNEVLYNDVDPLVVEYVRNAINGVYNDKKYLRWVSREEFDKMKNKDPFIAYAWSFGTHGKEYCISKKDEEIRCAEHNLIIKGESSVLLDNRYDKCLEGKTIQQRYKMFKKINNSLNKNNVSLFLPHYKRITSLSYIKNNPKIQISNVSYEEYQYKDGDIVYCDIPYENASQYKTKFDVKKFYDWCYSRPYPVFFSSYKISDKRFECVFCKRIRSLMAAKKLQDSYSFEYLYSNR